MAFKDPIEPREFPTIGADPIGFTPVFEFSPTEPAEGVLLKENGLPLLQENGDFISL